MRGFVLQPWTTIKGASTTPSIIQSEVDWLDLAPFSDFVAWVEVKEMTAGGSTAQTIFIESAPIKQEALFTVSNASQTSLPLVVGVSTARNIFNALPALRVPLARFLRWRVALTSPATNWSVTFQVQIAAHSMCLPGGA